jgi:hypothetical protein
MKAIVMAAMVALSTMAASAEDDYGSANYMLPHCKIAVESGDGNFVQGFCAGTVFGLAFAAQLPAILAEKSQAQALNRRCLGIPESVTPKQMVLVVVHYIEARPERMHESFRSLALLMRGRAAIDARKGHPTRRSSEICCRARVRSWPDSAAVGVRLERQLSGDKPPPTPMEHRG